MAKLLMKVLNGKNVYELQWKSHIRLEFNQTPPSIELIHLTYCINRVFNRIHQIPLSELNVEIIIS